MPYRFNNTSEMHKIPKNHALGGVRRKYVADS